MRPNLLAKLCLPILLVFTTYILRSCGWCCMPFSFCLRRSKKSNSHHSVSVSCANEWIPRVWIISIYTYEKVKIFCENWILPFWPFWPFNFGWNFWGPIFLVDMPLKLHFWWPRSKCPETGARCSPSRRNFQNTYVHIIVLLRLGYNMGRRIDAFFQYLLCSAQKIESGHFFSQIVCK